MWDADDAKGLIPYLSTFNHPIFDLSDDKSEQDRNEMKNRASVSTLVSGRELSIYMGLPKKSISGIPVVECASFGRNVLYAENSKEGKKIDCYCGSVSRSYGYVCHQKHKYKDYLAFA